MSDGNLVRGTAQDQQVNTPFVDYCFPFGTEPDASHAEQNLLFSLLSSLSFSFSRITIKLIPRAPEPLASPRRSSATIGRVESSAHLTISEYMQGINESTDAGDDVDSLFF